MANRQSTPGEIFSELLEDGKPEALAWVTGSAAVPTLSGLVKFYNTPYGGTLVEAELFGLPGQTQPGSSQFYAMHIHENGDCSNNFQNTGEHFNRVFDSLIMKKVLLGLVRPIFFCQNFCFIL